jgi:molybdopterin-guanine dinucleotide biosynthesis protein A
VAALGIFVGGASRRMGGAPKGLLPAPGGAESIAARLVRVGREVGLAPVLVGEAAPYAGLGLPVLADEPPGVGPLGGLAALLAHAGDQPAIALACDMPGVTRELLLRLAASARRADVIAARRGERWEPFFARYDSAKVLPVLRAAIREGVRSFQDLFARLAVVELAIGDEEWHALVDWDEPGDVTR